MMFWNGIREQCLNETVGVRLPQDSRDISIFLYLSTRTIQSFFLSRYHLERRKYSYDDVPTWRHFHA